MTQKKENKLFRIDVNTAAGGGGSTYYAAGPDAHTVFSMLVAHDEKEGNWAHQDELSLTIEVEPLDLATTSFVGWELS